MPIWIAEIWLGGVLGGAGAGLIAIPICTMLAYFAIQRPAWAASNGDRPGADWALTGLMVLNIAVLLWARSEWNALMLSGVLAVGALYCWIWGWLGWSKAKALLLPISFGLFSLPWELFLRQSLDLPLQELTTDIAAVMLRGLGHPVEYWDSMTLYTEKFYVIVNETCSGMNMLVTLAMYTIVFTWFAQRRLRNRLIVLAMVPLIAMLANGVRVTVIFMLGVHGGEELANGVWHTGSAYIIFLPVFWLIAVVNSALTTRDRRRQASGGSSAG